MNYRHAFHAGNHTEIFKHATLTLVLAALKRKPQPFAVLDTHAGLGVYDLGSPEAGRTNEKADGIERVFGSRLATAPEYSDAIEALNGNSLVAYPGSPELARSSLREDDRLVLCELHPEDGVKLKRRYARDPRVSVHLRDGYEAMGALLPPRERRGLVFIDPPFERRDEVKAVAGSLSVGRRKWATGIYLVWYPIKGADTGDAIAAGAVSAGFSDVLRAEFCPFERSGSDLAGGGIVLCNPPWTMDDQLRSLCRELSSLLGNGRASWLVENVR